MATEPRTARGRATRQRIVQATAELLSERGVAGTALDDVRERAHASKSQLYLYFPDRDALLRAAAQATCEEVLSIQDDMLSHFDSFDGIARYLDAMVALQYERGGHGGCPIGSLAGQLVEQDEAARQTLADGFTQWEEGLRAGLETMADRGDFKPDVQPERLATQILALIQGGLLLTQVRRDPGQLRIAADAVLDVVSGAM